MSAIVTPAGYVGNFMEDATVTFKFNTHTAAGAPITLAGTPAIKVYKVGDATEVTTGITLTEAYDAKVGLHEVAIDTSDAFYATAKDYYAFISAGTVDSVSAVGVQVGHFSIQNRPVILADGKAHGGTLGSSTATLALQRLVVAGNSTSPSFLVTNAGNGHGVSFESSSSGYKAGFNIIGAATGIGMQVEGGDGLGVTGVTNHGSGVYFTGPPGGGAGLVLFGGDGDGLVPGSDGLQVLGGSADTAGAGQGFNIYGGDGSATGSAGAGVKIASGADNGAAGAHAVHVVTSTPASKNDVALLGSGLIQADFAAFTETYAADGATVKLSQALYEILSFLEERSTSSTTVTCKKRDGSTTALTLTLNSATQPTSITRAT